ncbi:hypothetical protein G6F28_005586 [Rhizopus arrhizus]|nr:hypothetical protein G6F28_005586 [Rhizopus arrhizus]
MDLESRYPKCQAYPPVPNWYSSNVTAVMDPHFFLYATRNYIVMLDLKELRYFNSFTASFDKINAIATHGIFCFTAGVDKIVRVWNTLTNTLTTSYSEHKAEITALQVFQDGPVIISGDKNGRIVVARPFGKGITSLTKVKAEVTCISTVTYNNTNYAAIGYANGLIFIEEITEDLNLKTVYQIASDNDPIQSLDWQKRHDPTCWPLLAFSTKRLKRIAIYQFPSQTLFTSIRIPNAPAKSTEQQRTSLWIELSWSPCYDNKIYLSSYVGTILVFDVTESGAKICNTERLEKHNKQVIKWDVKKKSCLQIMKTQAGFPYALDISPLTPHQMAVGMGDNAIKLWEFKKGESVMSNNKDKYHDYYKSTIFWKQLYGKIQSIVYHPSRQGVLAYGNEYGRVGIYDIMNQRNQVFKIYQKTMECPILAWGPDLSSALEDECMTDTLLSCSGNKVLVYNAREPESSPVLLNTYLEQHNIAWTDSLKSKEDFHRTCMAVNKDHIAFGHMDGVIEVYSLTTFQLLYASICHRKRIMAMDWKEGYLATGCEQGVIAIHSLADKLNNKTETVIPQAEAYKLIKGHKKAITVLKWTYEPNKYIVASGTEDGLVSVWEMDKLISVFDEHRAMILSICWNHEDFQNLFSSSEDRFIYQWNYSDYETLEPIQSKFSLLDKEKVQLNKEKKKRIATSDAKQNESKKQKIVQVTQDMMIETQQSEKTTSQLKKGQKCLRIANVMFEGRIEAIINELKNKELTEEERCDPTVTRYMSIFNQDEDDNIYAHLFGDKEDILRLVEIEEKSIQLNNDIESLSETTQCRFDKQLAMNLMLSQADTLFNENKECLTDWIVLSMSPQGK